MGSLRVYILLGLGVFASGTIASAESSRVSVVVSEAGELDLSELVFQLAAATGVEIERPSGVVPLPVTGLAGKLSRTMLAESLGPDVVISVEKRALVVAVGAAQLATSRRDEWAKRLADLGSRAEREARRRLSYGFHALKSYRPNDLERPTICLVHGMNSSSYGFVHMIPLLEQAGFGVVVYDYAYNRDLDESCRRFARDWATFRLEMGERRPWALVGHSMGTLISRAYVEGADYGGDVSALVLIAPVNQGSHLAQTQTLLQFANSLMAVNGRKSTDAISHLGDGLGRAAEDMLPGSTFLKALNAQPRRTGVPYHILAGDVAVLPPDTRRQIEGRVQAARRQGGLVSGLVSLAVGGPDSLSDRLDEITDGSGDGCVSVARTKLEGVNDHVVIHANHAELIRAPLLFSEPGPVACMPYLLRWLGKP